MDGIIGTAGQKDASENDSVLDAHVISLRLMFSAWMSHFRSLGYIKETTMDMLDRTVCKQSVERSVKDPKVRYVESIQLEQISRVPTSKSQRSDVQAAT